MSFGGWRAAVACLLLLLGIAAQGCRSTVDYPQSGFPEWDIQRAEIMSWKSNDPFFDQDFALEASGLAASHRYLIVPSEKYATLLLIGFGPGGPAQAVTLDVPLHAELEGVALHDRILFLCDEAHAAVYWVSLLDAENFAAGRVADPLVAREMSVHGVSVRGGKIGFEGIEVSPDGNRIFVLLERSGNEESGCVSRVFRFGRRETDLMAEGDPLEVELEDCFWRLTGLAWWGNKLLALKTRFPGERYEVVSIDLITGESRVVLEMTEFLRSLREGGWSNNVEGIAITSDGALWLVADNAVTGTIDDPRPPRTDERTLLIRIPPISPPAPSSR
jgi:hypothetical protein